MTTLHSHRRDGVVWLAQQSDAPAGRCPTVHCRCLRRSAKIGQSMDEFCHTVCSRGAREWASDLSTSRRGSQIMSGLTLLAVSSSVKDVLIPLVAAAVTAGGIVVPLWVQRSRDRKSEAAAYDKALRSIHRDAAFLVEQIQLIGLRGRNNETVGVDELAPATSASTRSLADSSMIRESSTPTFTVQANRRSRAFQSSCC